MWTQIEEIYVSETLAFATVICNSTLKWKLKHRFLVTSAGVFDEAVTFWMVHRHNVCQGAEWMSRQMNECHWIYVKMDLRIQLGMSFHDKFVGDL